MLPLNFARPASEPISKEVFSILNDKNSRFSLLPKEVIERNLAPFLRNPFTVCEFVESNEYTKDKDSRTNEDVKLHLRCIKKHQFNSWKIYTFQSQHTGFKITQTVLGQNLLFRACEKNLKSVQNVLEWGECRLLNSGNIYLQTYGNKILVITPLIRTIFTGGKERREICRLLLNNGANPNQAGYSSTAKFTPLWAAIKIRDEVLTEMLINKQGYIFPPLDRCELEFYNRVKEGMRLAATWGVWG